MSQKRGAGHLNSICPRYSYICRAPVSKVCGTTKTKFM